MPITLRIAHALHVFMTHARAIALVHISSKPPDPVIGYGCLLWMTSMFTATSLYYGRDHRAVVGAVLFGLSIIGALRAFLKHKQTVLPLQEQHEWLGKQTAQIQHVHAGMRQPVRQSDWNALQRMAAAEEGWQAKLAKHRANYLENALPKADEPKLAKARL